ncbi:hypothetical protein AHF37_02650 [Paragonimus kellicotti]|nr:hypothetical protein AHF37_02650 [Paragonimus kellicotti]
MFCSDRTSDELHLVDPRYNKENKRVSAALYDDKQKQRNMCSLRPHQCDSCLKEFARKCDLLRHANSVHRESKPYMCPICNKGFPQKWYFERHVASVHKSKYSVYSPTQFI